MDRRRFLLLSGVAAATATAGCLGDDDTPADPEYGDWFDNVPHFEGFEDVTDREEITVLVGAGEYGFLYEPPAITVVPGTRVRFEWTGEGGAHEVSERDDEWSNPGGLTESADHTWERPFEEPGTHLYKCWPHRANGMKGGVFVDAHTG
ncbi:hypothetical protein BRC65_07275 [Halobacteriales archaeon QH_2_65_14]|nr:MAG: hypothetical protein BRC65_07275 [Halobacteriales archaeon QH_2_65_14]